MDNPTSEITQNLNTAIFLIASLSPTASKSLELESYRESANSDDATDQYILEEVLQSLVKDTQEIGLIINADLSQLAEEPSSLYDFISLLTYLLPNSLYPLLKSNEPIRNCVYHLITGSLGDNETLVQTYLSELGGLDGQTALVPELSSIIDHHYPIISQTETFTDYLKNLYDLVTQERITIEADPDHHISYRNKIKDLIGRLSDVVNNMAHHLLYNDLCAIQNIVIKDLIVPDNFTEYNYLFNTDPTLLPEGIRQLHEMKNYHYQVSHPWCLDYHQVRKQTPSPGYVMMMYAFLYAVISREENYTEIAKKLSEVYPSPDVANIITNLYKG